MTKKPHTGKRKRTRFSLNAPDASEVLLAGDFNQWNGKKHPMKKTGTATWEKILILAPGTYEYKYIVDGTWQEDPSGLKTGLNRFGTVNNIVTIPD